MDEQIKETVTTQTSGTNVSSRPTEPQATTSQTTEYLIYFIFGLLEAFLVFRFFFKILGASSVSGFVQFVYKTTNLFIMPFEGIFGKALSQGIESTSVFEPATLLSIVFYGLLAMGIVKLVMILSGKKQDAS
jgi:glucan phosphoethanolaminetransferase (alkaline phosphatase superfamily)